MNIFVTDECPILAARNLDSKRVVKMVLESAQMLSNALHDIKPELAPYKKTHWNHPCSIWVRDNSQCYHWLLRHFVALCSEYTHRYGNIHKCQQYIPNFTEGLKIFIVKYPYKFQHFFPDPKPGYRIHGFINCTTNHKHIQDVREAYRLEMIYKWKNDKRKPTWHDREIPTWAKDKF